MTPTRTQRATTRTEHAIALPSRTCEFTLVRLLATTTITATSTIDRIILVLILNAIKCPGGAPVKIEMFLPHEIYAALMQDADLRTWCLSPERLEQKLGKVLRDWAVHPDVQSTDDLTKVGMLGLHCDGAQYTSTMRAGGAKSVVVASINIVSAQSAVDRANRQLVFVVSKAKLCDCGCGGFHTYQVLFEVFSWSMWRLLEGLTSDCRHDGAPFTAHDQANRLPAGTAIPKAALLQLRGDWEWLVTCFRFRFYTSDSFCWLCDATLSAGPNCYTNFEEDAPHRATLISHEQYIEACALEGAPVSTLFRSPGTRLEHATIDSMHGGDSGTFPDAIGSLFWCENTHKAWHRKFADGLSYLNKELAMYYTANRQRRLTKITPLAKTQIRSKKPPYPVLKASAAGARHVADFCLSLAYLHQNGDGLRPPFRFRPSHRLAGRSEEHCRLQVEIFGGMVQYHRACAETPFDRHGCKNGVYTYLRAMKQINALWRVGVAEDKKNNMPWHLRQKCHMMVHLVEDKVPMYGSPSSFWCYCDEDYMGTVKAVCAMTKHPSTLERRVLEKTMIMAGVTRFYLLDEVGM